MIRIEEVGQRCLLSYIFFHFNGVNKDVNVHVLNKDVIFFTYDPFVCYVFKNVKIFSTYCL